MKCIISDKSPARAQTHTNTKQQSSFNRRANVLAVLNVAVAYTSHTKAPLCATFRVPFLFCNFLLRPFVFAIIYTYISLLVRLPFSLCFRSTLYSLLCKLTKCAILNFFFLFFFTFALFLTNNTKMVNKGYQMLLNNFFSLCLFIYLFSQSVLICFKFLFSMALFKCSS